MSVKHEVLSKTGTVTVQLTPLKAIKLRCLDCSGFNRAEVLECPITTCALFPFRLGHVARVKGLSEEAKKKATDRLRRYRFCAGHAEKTAKTREKISIKGVARG